MILTRAGKIGSGGPFSCPSFVQRSLHRPCGLEIQSLRSSNLDRLAGLGITTLPRASLGHTELAEPEDRDFLALLGNVSDGSKQAVNHVSCERLRYIVLFDKGFDQVVLGVLYDGTPSMKEFAVAS